MVSNPALPGGKSWPSFGASPRIFLVGGAGTPGTVLMKGLSSFGGTPYLRRKESHNVDAGFAVRKSAADFSDIDALPNKCIDQAGRICFVYENKQATGGLGIE